MFCFVLFFLSGGNYFACVLAESDWVRGWKGRAAGLDSIPPTSTCFW